ncbi:MAG: porin [Gammaproteobacteria bacterium]|nr:porin [Gammaproteobacteria bacterium]
MRRLYPLLGFASLGIMMSVNANASGFRLPEASIAGVGTSNALVANYKELGAVAYNPAAMSFHNGTNIVAGLILIDHKAGVTPVGKTGKIDSDHDSLAYVPNLSVINRRSPQWSWGFNINAPFGLETNWPKNTFPVPASMHPAETRIELINFNPNVSYKINANTSAAVGLDYYKVREVKLNTQAATINGDGGDFGWNAALMHVAGPWSFGASYRSAITVGVDGKLTSTSGTTPVVADVNLPWMLQVGARYQATDKLGVEFDYERTGWKKFNQIIVAETTGSPRVINSNGWGNADAYRLGMTYDLNANNQLRAGYARDMTGQGDAHFSARVPDADRNLFSVGLRHKLAGGWELEGAYMYVRFDDRNYVSTTPFTPSPSSVASQDPNGTVAYNGKYENSAQLLGLGVTKRF